MTSAGGGHRAANPTVRERQTLFHHGQRVAYDNCLPITCNGAPDKSSAASCAVTGYDTVVTASPYRSQNRRQLCTSSDVKYSYNVRNNTLARCD